MGYSATNFARHDRDSKAFEIQPSCLVFDSSLVSREAHSSTCSLTVVCADIAAAHVGRVVVEGNVPLPAAGPAVEHHYVVLRPADKEVGVLQVRALLI